MYYTTDGPETYKENELQVDIDEVNRRATPFPLLRAAQDVVNVCYGPYGWVGNVNLGKRGIISAVYNLSQEVERVNKHVTRS